jgi:hypothetical protein
MNVMLTQSQRRSSVPELQQVSAHRIGGEIGSEEPCTQLPVSSKESTFFPVQSSRPARVGASPPPYDLSMKLLPVPYRVLLPVR